MSETAKQSLRGDKKGLLGGKVRRGASPASRAFSAAGLLFFLRSEFFLLIYFYSEQEPGIHGPLLGEMLWKGRRGGAVGGVRVTTLRMGEGPLWREAGREGHWRKPHTVCTF